MTRSYAPRGPSRWLAPPLLLLAAGCTAPPAAAPAASVPVPFADCATLTAAPSAASPSPPSAPAPSPPSAPAPASTSSPASKLPDVTVPCFAGGQPVRLADLSGPAVVNLWASYCGPCRDELPALQRLAGRTTGRLHVVGVATGEPRDTAASFGTDAGVTFPTVYDRDQRLLQAVGKRALPVTVFLDAAGRTYVYNGRSLDDARLSALVTERTGVAVAP